MINAAKINEDVIYNLWSSLWDDCFEAKLYFDQRRWDIVITIGKKVDGVFVHNLNDLLPDDRKAEMVMQHIKELYDSAFADMRKFDISYKEEDHD